jgi:hypothetical protein
MLAPTLPPFRTIAIRSNPPLPWVQHILCLRELEMVHRRMMADGSCIANMLGNLCSERFEQGEDESDADFSARGRKHFNMHAYTLHTSKEHCQFRPHRCPWLGVYTTPHVQRYQKKCCDYDAYWNHHGSTYYVFPKQACTLRLPHPKKIQSIARDSGP